MACHPIVGAEIVDGIEFLSEAAKVVRSHHERWDGTGYADGLRAEEIPLAAHVFAAADVLDALTTDRPYRPRLPLAEARAMIVEASGTAFDPMVVSAFQQIDDATIVILTAAHGDRIEAAAELAGADHFLTKPFSPLELLRPVDRLGGDVPA